MTLFSLSASWTYTHPLLIKIKFFLGFLVVKEHAGSAINFHVLTQEIEESGEPAGLITIRLDSLGNPLRHLKRLASYHNNQRIIRKIAEQPSQPLLFLLCWHP